MDRRLPNGDQAILDVRKLADYCLSSMHPRGRHKARVFREALGIGPGDAIELRDQILAAASQNIADELLGDFWAAAGNSISQWSAKEGAPW